MERASSIHRFSIRCAVAVGLLAGWMGIVSAADPQSPSVPICGTVELLGKAERIAGATIYDPRPPLGTYILGSTHFRVHYEDSTLTPYARSIIQAAEESFAALVDSLGCAVPPSDGTNGGDERTDIYVIPAGSVAFTGQAVPEEFKPTALYPNAWTSFIELIDTIPSGLVGVVTAHEYFHVIQLGYDKDEDVRFYEMLSVWGEDYVYDDVNHYLARLPAFFAQPQVPLMNWRYSNVLWAMFLDERFGEDIIAEILHRGGVAPGLNWLDATDGELVSRGSSLSAAFAEFTIWNYFTGPRDDGKHYEEASLYPTVRIEKDVECIPLSPYATAHRPGPLACNYITLLGEHSPAPLRLALILNPDAQWIVSVTRFEGSFVSTEYHYYPETVGWDPRFLLLDDLAACDSILLIPNVVSREGTYFDYSISASRLESAAGESPYVLVLDRDGCRRPFDGTNDAFGPVDGEEIPLINALSEVSVPFVLSDSIPADLSLCETVFVVGGFDRGGCNMSDEELRTLVDFVDSGGDIYLESPLLGRYLDPALGDPSPVQEAFWALFGSAFRAGDPAAVGNVSSWRTTGVLGRVEHRFDYDYMSEPDDSVGALVPLSGTDTLITDQWDAVRGTVSYGPSGSERICVTVLLGGSVPSGSSPGRGDYVRSILELFGWEGLSPPVPAGDVLSVSPNPSSGSFGITYVSSSAGAARLAVYDVKGREIHAEELYLYAGANTFRLDPSSWGEPMTSGLYFLRVERGGNSVARKILLIR